MKRILAIIFFLCANYVFAQDTTAIKPVNPYEGKTFTVVENMPQFPGGEKKLFKFLKKNMKYPKEARQKGIQGKVYVNFIVDTEGIVREVRVIKGASPELDAEAIRVVKLMPKWKPGTQNGKRVNVYYNLPIVFTLK